jgi:hypothetical protein
MTFEAPIEGLTGPPYTGSWFGERALLWCRTAGHHGEVGPHILIPRRTLETTHSTRPLGHARTLARHKWDRLPAQIAKRLSIPSCVHTYLFAFPCHASKA